MIPNPCHQGHEQAINLILTVYGQQCQKDMFFLNDGNYNQFSQVHCIARIYSVSSTKMYEVVFQSYDSVHILHRHSENTQGR